jgi:hypothetical protein
MTPPIGESRSRDHAVRRRRVLTIALVAAATALVALIAARPAGAGSYVATQCSAADQGSGATWERTSSSYRERRRCLVGDGLQVFQDAGSTAHGRYGAWVWRAPAGTVFTSLQANVSLLNHAGHRGELWATRTSGSRLEFGNEHRDFRVHNNTGSFSRLESMLRCVSRDGCGRASDEEAHAYAKGVFLRVDDRSSPEMTTDGGSLLDGAVVRGTRSLAYRGSDRGGGVRRVSLAANDTEVASDVRNCELADGFATALSPCPPTVAGSWSVNTAAVTFDTGPNRIAACASDLALDGSPHRDCDIRQVWVDNVCPASTVAVSQLTAHFRRGGDRATIRSDRPASIEGRVLGEGGQPVAGATVCALTRVALYGSPVLVARTASTDDEGRYRLALPRGASRRVFVHHVHGSTVVSRHGLTLRSRVRPTFAVDPERNLANGDRLTFSGRLPGPACSQRVVKVQAKVDTRWQVFRTDRTDARCRYVAHYRLRTTREATEYRFRALVPPQTGYPYERGRSKARRASVTGRSGR